jgi:hypothetical protein
MVRTGQHREISTGSGKAKTAGSFEHASKHMSSIKCTEFIDKPRNY